MIVLRITIATMPGLPLGSVVDVPINAMRQTKGGTGDCVGYVLLVMHACEVG
jgi:hypothetical protein